MTTRMTTITSGLALLVALHLNCASSSVPDHILPQWKAPPRNTPSSSAVDGPLMGNGRLGVAIGTAEAGELTFYLDRNDAWVPATGDISCCGYDPIGAGGRTVGTLQLMFPTDANTTHGFTATQQISNGTVTTSQPTAFGGILHTLSFVVRGVDAMVTEVWWEVPTNVGANVAPSPLIMSAKSAQGDVKKAYCHSFESGTVNDTATTWASRTLGFPYQNVPTSQIGRRHFYKASWCTAIGAQTQNDVTPPSPHTARSANSHADIGDIGVRTHEGDDVICTMFDGQCLSCQNHTDSRPVWASKCLMLDGGVQAGHTCVPAKWWAEYGPSLAPIKPCAVGCKGCPIPKVPGQFTLEPNGARVTLITVVQSNFEDDNYTDPTPTSQALAVAAATNTSLVAQWRSEHAIWWSLFWNRSSVSLPTSPLLETQWYGSLYILASSHDTTPGSGASFSVAPGIVWPITNDSPAFRGAFTMNYNQESVYYGVFSANHPEIAQPYNNAMVQYIPRGQKDAQTQFQCPGINIDCEIFHWGQSTSAVGDQGQRSNSLLGAVPLANQWLWTRDIAWLNQTGWPFLSEVASFWECYLARGLNYPGTPPGSYSSVNDCFNELCESAPTITNVNPHISISLLRFLLPVFIDAAEALQIEPERRTTWANLLDHLAPLPIANLSDGTRVFGGVLGAEKSSMPGPKGNPLTSYLGWPGYDDQITTNTELQTVLKNTIDYLQSWGCGNCWPQYPAAKIRTQDRKTEASATWATMTALLKGMIQTNLIITDGVGNTATAMESTGGIGAVNEMLLQSHTKKGMEFFPQVPPGTPAAFQGLRARGGFVVSASMKLEMVSDVTITNDAKDNTPSALAKLKSPWWPLNTTIIVREISSNNNTLPVSPTGVVGWFQFTAMVGKTYTVAPGNTNTNKNTNTNMNAIGNGNTNTN